MKSTLIRVVSVIGAVIVASLILRYVLIFAYYASGLAVDHMEEKRKREAPIPIEFSDPNRPADREPESKQPEESP